MSFFRSLVTFIAFFSLAIAQSATPTAGSSTGSASSASQTVTSGSSSGAGTNSTTSISTTSSASTATAPDVYLNVPTLSVGRIELDVDNLTAELNLAAKVASLVTVNAGVNVAIEKVNLTIVDVEAEVELVVRLGNLVDIVGRVFDSLDLNPLLITALNDVTQIVDDVVGSVDSLLGSITQGGKTLSFIVDNLGNIVQEVTGTAEDATSTIVGNYLQNMTLTATKELSSGNVQKTYEYSPLNALVDIVFNSAGQILQATTNKSGSSSSSSSTSTSSAASVTSTST